MGDERACRSLVWAVLKAAPAWSLRKLFRRSPPVEYRTVDGGRLCPHPGMTDDDLDDYEREFNVPGRKR